MKKLLIASTLLLTFTANAINCPQYVCNNPVYVTGNMTNQNYNGNQCFEGTTPGAKISNSTNWNNWFILSFAQTIQVDQTWNFANGARKVMIKSNANIHAKSFNMDGGDTIFNAGNFIVDSYTSNNSLTNVIVRQPGSTVTIAGITYNRDTILNNVGSNPTNVLVITSCNATALPVTFKYFKYDSGFITWEFSEVRNVSLIILERSINNGILYNDWEKANFIIPDYQYRYKESLEGSYRLKIRDFSGQISYSNVVSIRTKIPADVETMVYTEDGRFVGHGLRKELKFMPGRYILRAVNNVEHIEQK